MRNFRFYQSDFGAPPPPPPPGTPPPPPPSYGSNISGPNMPSGMQGSASANAIIALVAGILSFVMCPLILGVVAWIMGKSENGKIERGESPSAGKTLAQIGMWLGIANVILSILVLLAYVLIIVIALISSN
jgi:hypothetical protein